MNTSNQKPLEYQNNFRCFSNSLTPIVEFIDVIIPRLQSFEITWSAKDNSFKFCFQGDFLLDELYKLLGRNGTTLMYQSLKIMDKDAN